MPLISFNNHFRFGYNSEAFNFRQSPEDKWWVSYGRCSRMPYNFREECIETAKLIASEASGPIWILFSGGVDSEVMLQSFVLAKVPVRVAIVRFKHDLNIHDISYAVIACEKLGVPYYLFDLDLFSFWEGEALEYAARTLCPGPALLSTMWLMDQLDGFPVLGSGECYLVKRRADDYEPGVSEYPKGGWEMWEKELIAGWYRHLMNTNRDGSAGFFQYTPEIMLSYLLDQDIVDLVSDKKIGRLSTKSSKLGIYQKYFDLIGRPKFTGYEKARSKSREFRRYLISIYPHHRSVYKTPYDDLINQLWPDEHGKFHDAKELG